MRARKSDNELLKSGEGSVKFVDNKQLHDESARTELIAVAEKILEGSASIEQDDYMDLFKGMHACAYELNMPSLGTSGDVSRNQRLSDLHKRIQDHLFQANIGLVYDMRRRSKVPRGDDDGLNSEGFWSLYQAIRGFDPWRGYKFSTYACTSILRGFLLVARTESRRKDRIKATMENPQFTNEATEEVNPRMELMRDRVSAAVTGSAGGLTPVERFVIERRFLQRPDTRRETLEAVGKLIEVSKERVRQIEQAGLAKLRNTLQQDPLFEQPAA